MNQPSLRWIRPPIKGGKLLSTTALWGAGGPCWTHFPRFLYDKLFPTVQISVKKNDLVGKSTGNSRKPWFFSPMFFTTSQMLLAVKTVQIWMRRHQGNTESMPQNFDVETPHLRWACLKDQGMCLDSASNKLLYLV